MATSLKAPASTREKLLRAQEAAARLAQLTSEEKNNLLLAIAQAIPDNAAKIIEANRADLDSSALAGAMRDRLLLTRSVSPQWPRASAKSLPCLIRLAK